MSLKTNTTKLLKLMGFSKPEVIVTKTDDDTTIQINVSELQTGALIGYHGETITALQLILNLIYNQSQADWKPVRVNVGDYRQRREVALTELAQTSAARAKSSGKDVILTSLPSNERRLIHLALADDQDIETFSEGAGRFRRLIIRPKKPS